MEWPFLPEMAHDMTTKKKKERSLFMFAYITLNKENEML